MRRYSKVVIALLVISTFLPQAFTQSIVSPHSAGNRIESIWSQKDSARKRFIYAKIPSERKSDAIAARQTNATCNNTTFYLRIPAPAGQTLELSDVETFPDGDYCLAVTQTLPGNKKVGLLMRLTNNGALVKVEQVKIGSKNLSLAKIKIRHDGKIMFSGILQDNSNSIVLGMLNPDFSPGWIKTLVMPELPEAVTLDLREMDDPALLFAVQQSAAVIAGVMNTAGDLKWQKKIDAPGLTSLAGFAHLNYGRLGLILNSILNGVQVSVIVQINQANGAITQAHVKDNQTHESKVLAVTSYSTRASIVSINRSAQGFNLQRNITYESALSETRHTHSYNTGLNFDIAAAIDNSGDIIAVSIPDEGKLFLVKQFADYYSPVLFSKTYNVPMGSQVSAVARSFDGGILTGLNTSGNNELVLIKTDSVGILSGCGYQTVANNAIEEIIVNNSSVTYQQTDQPQVTGTDAIAYNSIALPIIFNCQSSFCPNVVDDDTCVATYYKTLRSSSYSDLFSDYYLMRNNKQMVTTGRLDRIVSDLPVATAGVKLLDENGKFIKGVNVFANGASQGGYSYQLDDRSILLSLNSSVNNESRLSLICLSDDLQILWRTNIGNAFNFDNGLGSSDVYKDEEGNYYLFSVIRGFFGQKSKIYSVKLNAAGAIVWQKSYTIDRGAAFSVSVTGASSSIYAVVGSTEDVSTAFQLDKKTGAIKSAYHFNSLEASSYFKRYANYHNGKIYYAGMDEDQNILTIMFDENARPIKMRQFNSEGVLRAATFRGGDMYILSSKVSNDFAGYNNLLKLDNELNVVYAKRYIDDPNLGWRAKGMAVGTDESLYIGGNIYMNHDLFPYIAKVDPWGSLGTCQTIVYNPDISDKALQTNEVVHTSVPLNVPTFNNIVEVLNEPSGYNIGNVVCKTSPECTSIKISGSDTVCLLNTDYLFEYAKPTLCTTQPNWMVDASIAEISGYVATGVNIKFKKPGNAKILAVLSGGCQIIADSMVAVVQSSTDALDLGADRILCPGDTLHLNAGGGFSKYQWQDLSADSIFIVQQPGTYHVEAGNACGDNSWDTVVVNAGIVPALSLGEDTIVCKSSPVVLAANDQFYNYYWYPAENIKGNGPVVTASFTQPQFIFLEAKTQEGCTARDTVFIDVKQSRTFSLGNDTGFCASTSVTFTPGLTYQSYTWNNGSTDKQLTVGEAGSYWLHATDFNGCVAADTVVVTSIYPTPVVNLGNDFNLCEGDSRTFDAGNFASYQWMDGTTSRYYSTNDAGAYSVSVTDINGCAGSDTINIKLLLRRPFDFLPQTDSLCEYESLFLSPFNTYSSYSWSNGSTQASLEVSKVGSYTLSVTDQHGCRGTDTISIVPKNCLSGLFIPSAFTPNADYLNDIFRAKVFGKVVLFKLEIFNRFGELIFRTNDPKVGWDGMLNGMPMPSGVFAWQCLCQFEGNEPLYKKGTVSLIR